MTALHGSREPSLSLRLRIGLPRKHDGSIVRVLMK
jgi:hypothetical protein